MELEYFNKYKEYYDVLSKNTGILKASENLSSECTNLFEQSVSNYFNSIIESDWEESGKDITTNVILNGLKNDFEGICDLINNNLVAACNIAIKSLLPKLNEIYQKNTQLNNITNEIYTNLRAKNQLESSLSKLSNTNPENLNGAVYTTVINESEERNNLQSSLWFYNEKLNELYASKEVCINELNVLCNEANMFIIAILDLDESLSDSNITALVPVYIDEQLNSFYNQNPQAKEMFNYYAPILQKKLGIIDSNIMYKMLMETYISLGADKDQNNIPKYGSFNAFLNAITNNCPNNYKDFKFEPNITDFSNLELENKIDYYNLRNGFDNKYIITREKINIKDNCIEFVQVLPGSTNKFGESKTSLTSLEQHFYDIYKANVVNTINDKIPVRVLESICSDTDIKFVMPYDKEVLLNNTNDKVCPGIYDMRSGSICIEPIGTLNNNDLYVKNAVAHQIGHKFDANYNNGSIHRNLSEKVHEIFNGNVDAISYSSNTKDSRFYVLAQKYADRLEGINNYSVSPEVFKHDTVEFFASSFDAYVNNEGDLNFLCPEAHSAINQMIDKKW